jgi:hypothetical protein
LGEATKTDHTSSGGAEEPFSDASTQRRTVPP